MGLVEVLRELYPVLAALFALEGVGWSSPGQQVLWRAARRFRVLGSGLRLLPRLPWDQVVVIDELRPFPTAEGVFLPRSRSETASRPHERERWELLPWAEIATLEREQASLLVGRRRLRLSSPGAAARAVRLLLELACASDAERIVRLAEHQRSTLDFAAAAERRHVVEGESFDARALGSVVFAIGALALPLLLWPEPARTTALTLVLGALLLAWQLLLSLATAARHRLADACVPLPGQAVLALILSPPASVLAAAALTREAWDGFDPAVVAATLLPPGAAAKALRRRAAIADAATGAGEAGWRQHWRGVAATARAQLSALSAEPAPDECPVCHSRFREPPVRCPDCLVPLSTATVDDPSGSYTAVLPP